jgi:hypothetical protein
MISNAHDVVAKKIFFILDLPEQRLESVTSVKGSKGAVFGIDDGDMQEAFFLHQFPGMLQPVAGATERDVPRHDRGNHRRAGMPLALTDARNDVRLTNDTDHLIVGVTDDDEVSAILTEERGGLNELGSLTYPDKTVTGGWQHSFDVHGQLLKRPLARRLPIRFFAAIAHPSSPRKSPYELTDE